MWVLVAELIGSYVGGRWHVPCGTVDVRAKFVINTTCTLVVKGVAISIISDIQSNSDT